MNPGDFLLLVLSLGFAAMSLLVHGFTPNGVGPALLATAGGFWQLGMQWLRYRSWLRHKDSDFIPGTQHLAIAAWLGWSLATFASVSWAWMAIRELRIEGQP
ncbi:MAG: hypothetical protein J5I93_26950 [Pirellulaceae bacterium]|nr:hypothetical protein [Pirellulaceae bacterium]